MTTLTITPVNRDAPVRFAAQELARYLRQMGNTAALCERGGSLMLGTYSALNFDRTEHDLDDGYAIHINSSGSGIIAGANPRSVLMGVYRYLSCCGCRFLYPGAGGEKIPECSWAECDLEEHAGYRYRCVSSGGSSQNGELRFGFLSE